MTSCVSSISQARGSVHGIRQPSPPLGAALLTGLAWAEVAKSLKLSARELEITHGLFDNLTETAIAANLRISEHTVHSYLNRLFKKLGVTTRTQLVLRVMQELLTLTNSHGSSLPPICRIYSGGGCPLKK